MTSFSSSVIRIDARKRVRLLRLRGSNGFTSRA